MPLGVYSNYAGTSNFNQFNFGSSSTGQSKVGGAAKASDTSLADTSTNPFAQIPSNVVPNLNYGDTVFAAGFNGQVNQCRNLGIA